LSAAYRRYLAIRKALAPVFLVRWTSQYVDIKEFSGSDFPDVILRISRWAPPASASDYHTILERSNIYILYYPPVTKEFTGKPPFVEVIFGVQVSV
jgi:hypothetical protein